MSLLDFLNSPDEIAGKLYELINDKEDFKTALDADDNEIIKDLATAISDIKAIAENPHNSDYWRTLYLTLNKLSEQ